METIRKALAVVSPGSMAEDEAPYGSFDVILSTATKDRDGEIIDTGAFNPLPDHIPFDIDHDMTVTSTVGSGRPYYDETGNLRVAGTFASTPLAQQVRTLISEGHVRTTSVTFVSADREEKDGIPHVTRAELINGTFTPVPANRDALVVGVKTIEEKEGRRNSGSDQAMIQQMHDLSVSAGAACEMKHTAPDLTEPEVEEKNVEPELSAAPPAADAADEAAAEEPAAAPPAADAADEAAVPLSRLSLLEATFEL